MSASSSEHNLTTVVPVPSRRAANPAKASRRPIRPVSVARTRALVRLPSAAWATTSAVSGSMPDSTSWAATASFDSVAKTIRTHLEAIVISSGVT